MGKAKSHFKFIWAPNKEPIVSRPVNVLDKKPNQYDIISVDSQATQCLTRFEQSIRAELAKPKYKNIKPQRYDQRPQPKALELGTLSIARSFQRPYDGPHVKHIVLNWDSRRTAAIQVCYNPVTKEYYITDGQHTALAYAIRARLGLFPDVNPEDWMRLKVDCMVVELEVKEDGSVDMSFCREHFLGINGGDKLKLADFDFYQNHVLAKRQDSPNDITEDEYEIAYNKQVIMEENDIIPVHKNSADRLKPGALTGVTHLKELSIQDVEFFSVNHKKYWPQEPVDAMELVPMQTLRRLILSKMRNSKEFESKEFKKFMEDLNATVKTTAGSWEQLKHLAQTTYTKYYRETMGVWAKKTISVPDDVSLVLLLKMYRAAGGDYQCVPESTYSRYTDNGDDLFNYLEPAKKELFK